MTALFSSFHCLKGSTRASSSIFPLLHIPFGRALSRLSTSVNAQNADLGSSSSSSGLTRSGEARFPAGRVPLIKAFGFYELGVEKPIVDALERAYPNVQRPTVSQAEFIPAILSGKDVLLDDGTGTGKSFGIILALLSRCYSQASHAAKSNERQRITSLVVVPHRDLAVQMMNWVNVILENIDGGSESSMRLGLNAQLAVRGESTPVKAQIRSLTASPPNILIGTPQALRDIHTKDKNALQFANLSTLVLDEVDYLLDIPPPYLRKKQEAAAWRNVEKHPSVTRQLLDELLPARKVGAVRLGEESAREKISQSGSKTSNLRSTQPLQVIMSSATIHSNMVDYVSDSRWLSDNYISISGRAAAEKNAHMILQDDTDAQEVIHHALIVSRNGTMTNAEYAIREDDDPDPKDESDASESVSSNSTRQQVTSETKKRLSPQLPVTPQLLEAVATFFVFDVPELALLVLPPNSSVEDAIAELNDLGVTSRKFDLRLQEINTLGSRSGDVPVDEPTLLVATTAVMRGVDLPRLSHVFILGVPDVGNVDVFKHIAGRVNRFGTGGKVVTFLNELEQEYREGMMRTTKNPAGLLRTFYRRLRIKPVWFDLSKLDLP